MKLLQTIYWDPPREAFTIPFVEIPIYWYSVLFCIGAFLAYLIVMQLIKNRVSAHDKPLVFRFVDRLSWYIFFGMIVGARLGHVFFYEWDYFAEHPIEILYIRSGGLSSHGGAVGIALAIYCFWWRNMRHQKCFISWDELLDYLAVVIALGAGFIRVGNFFNQEILGTPSTLPWAVIYGHPAESAITEPSHPVQLYEAFFYFSLFGILFYVVQKYEQKWGHGRVFGLFLTAVFSFRFFIEFWKLPQEMHPSGFLNMGQILSIPFIAVGIYFLQRKKNR